MIFLPRLVGECEGSRLVGGTRLVVFPRFLTCTGRRTPRAGTPIPLRAGTPPPPAGREPPPPPLLHVFEKGQWGKGSWLERGSRLVVFSNCGRFQKMGVGIPRAGSPQRALASPDLGRQFSDQPPHWNRFWRDFSEVRGGSGGSFRKGA